MWRHPEEGESSYIANYQNWALVNQVHTEEILNEINSARPTTNLSELELANSLNIDKKWVENARKQGLIKPITDTGLTRRYNTTNWNILRQVIGAQDRSAVEHLKQIISVYTTEDLIKKTGVDRSEVETRLKQEELFPLNGLHYSINLYGPKVLDLFKARKRVRNLLPNKTNVVTKREIPVNKKMVIPEKSTKEIEKTTDYETKPVAQLSEKPQNISDKKEKTVQPKENIAKIGRAHV